MADTHYQSLISPNDIENANTDDENDCSCYSYCFNDIDIFRKNMITFFKYFLFFECCVNATMILIALILLASDKFILSYVILLFVCYYIKIFFVNSMLTLSQNQSEFEQNFNNVSHMRNINTSVYFIVLFGILLAYGSFITQNQTFNSYYFSKIVNVNILFAEIIKTIGLMCATHINDYNSYNGYIWFVSM